MEMNASLPYYKVENEIIQPRKLVFCRAYLAVYKYIPNKFIPKSIRSRGFDVVVFQLFLASSTSRPQKHSSFTANTLPTEQRQH